MTDPLALHGRPCPVCEDGRVSVMSEEEMRDALKVAPITNQHYGKDTGLGLMGRALLQRDADAREQAEEVERLKAIIHHMTLMVDDFGHHDPACRCSGDRITHAPSCEDCECGLREAIEFGIEQSGISLEPEPATPEEEARLAEIAQRVVEEELSHAKEVASLRADNERLMECNAS